MNFDIPLKKNLISKDIKPTTIQFHQILAEDIEKQLKTAGDKEKAPKVHNIVSIIIS